MDELAKKRAEKGLTAAKAPPGETRERVRELLEQGLSQKEVGRRLGISPPTVSFHARNLGIPTRSEFAQRYDWPAIQEAHDEGLSMRECRVRFGFSNDAWYDAVKRGALTPRPHAMPIEDLLVAGRQTSRNHLKTRLISAGLKTNRCEECGISEWLDAPLSMHLHHRNGDGLDNRLENLQFLCPNCHSQTDTYGGRNGHRRPELRLVEPPDGGGKGRETG